MKRRGSKFVIALGVGLLVLGVLGMVTRIADSGSFYQLCAGIGLGLAALALFLQISVLVPRTKLEQSGIEHPHLERASSPAMDLPRAEARRATILALYLGLAALPCLVVAVVHYLG